MRFLRKKDVSFSADHIYGWIVFACTIDRGLIIEIDERTRNLCFVHAQTETLINGGIAERIFSPQLNMKMSSSMVKKLSGSELYS